jgi:phosphoribosylglycinamide formyltransferase 1
MKTLREFLKAGRRPGHRIVILISSKGSNMRAILGRIASGQLNAVCTLVLSDREAPGLAIARKMGIATEILARKSGEAREAFDERLAARLMREKPALVVCAGYLRILSKPMLRAFAGRIVNIHPSLLPAFPGLKAQKQALDYGVKITGCTVHVVDDGVDTGKILGQRAVLVSPGDTEESLSRRILRAEHQLYWQIIAEYLKKLSAVSS